MSKRWMFVLLAIVLVIGLFPDFSQGAQVNKEFVRIAMATEPLTLDHSMFSTGADTIVQENWGEYLISRAPSGELTPGLVTSWKISSDGKQIEFTLRKGAKFHSGDLLTAKDVAFSFERERAKNPNVKMGLLSVDRLEIVDDYHFKFHFKSPDVLFIPRRVGNVTIASKSYYERVGEEEFGKKPFGTGPYKLVEYKPGEYLDVERFEEYWGKKPPVKRARIYFVGEDTTRAAKMKAGEVDLINSVPYTSVTEFEKSPEFKVVKLATYHPTRGIAFGNHNPNVPWYDKRVRLAMAHAIDWQTIIHKLLQGIPNHFAALAPHELGYDPEVKSYAYDPKKAKALLAEAGYPNGLDVKLYWPVGGRVSMSQEIVEMVASYFEAVGIRTKLIGEENASILARRKVGKDPNSEYLAYYTAGVCGGVDPTHTIGQYFTKDGAFSTYYNPEVDKIIAEGRAEMNDKKRAELIKKAVRLLNEDVAFIPIFSNVAIFAMKRNVDFIPTQKINLDYLYIKDVTIK